ncbi:bifunctional arginine demethylase and lysyl-hydroxylase JMJD6-like [Actinia tenebrosa]|uniref:Bifunctional arginine demethylase and lysyl-hydroxylase JMJD6-like n=1 Tax=Actinia tenebrosa TaxID=6105 RepID=A0A6P8J138_ACTTE|nr:bifunctional arginine demethylase and lysyl-hydroxylase JMJD6-like [Actinia tenebrosa]
MSSKPSQELVSLFKELREKAQKSGVCTEDIKNEFKRGVKSRPRKTSSKITLFIVFFIIPVALGIGGYFSSRYLMDLWKDDLCLLNVNEIFNEVARKPTNCSLMCEGQTEVPRLSGLTRHNFIENYAYNGRPLVVTDAAKNWSALEVFNFSFFKQLYDRNNGSYEVNEEECQFFPYKTNFSSLREAFNMPKERAELKTEPWYFGWSNCDPVVREKLREHYQLPYFLPLDTETSQQDWLFMGGPGLGAQIHIDSVERPSWQAQLSGTKVWTLIPPPECEHVCSTLKAQVNKGEVIIVDTNQWFHKTEVLPGDISITIGAEFD